MASYTAAIRLSEECMMKNSRRHILIDPRTSCSRDEATAILLGRRFYDPIYPDHNPEGDPTEVQEQFMEWLDLSVFEQLIDERDRILMELDNATEAGDTEGIAACEARIVGCDETIRRAKLILCDMDDELAKGGQSKLRVDQALSVEVGQVKITLSSLKAWAEDRDYKSVAVDASLVQPAPPAQDNVEKDEPLLNAKGGMGAASTRSFMVTFAVLLEQYQKTLTPLRKTDTGSGINVKQVALLLQNNSLPGARAKHFLKGQKESSVEIRINQIIKMSGEITSTQRATSLKPTSQK